MNTPHEYRPSAPLPVADSLKLPDGAKVPEGFTARQYAFGLVVRQALVALLGGLEDFLRMPRSIQPGHIRKAYEGIIARQEAEIGRLRARLADHEGQAPGQR